MKRLESYDDLRKLRNETREKISSYSDPKNAANRVIIRVGMGTSGIASGATQVLELFREALRKRNIDAEVLMSGDMGYSYAEPTVQVTRPGTPPLVFGDVDTHRADEIIEKYIRQGEPVDGVIPVDYLTIEEI